MSAKLDSHYRLNTRFMEKSYVAEQSGQQVDLRKYSENFPENLDSI